MRQKFVIGNWKMNKTWEDGIELFTEIEDLLQNEDVYVILAPAFIFIAEFSKRSSIIKIAAQNCSHEPFGAFTGEISASMIKSAGGSCVIIGHSERRAYFGETNSMLSKKTDLALAEGLAPVFCIGESLDQRKNARHFETVLKQLQEGLFHLPGELFAKVVIAYEPVWAIGTGVNASAEQAQEMHGFIRKSIKDKYNSDIAGSCSVLYGGSCTAQNAKELFRCPDVDGGLIGGASLKSSDFVQIVRSF